MPDLNAMSDREYKTYEARLRRMAKRQNLMLCKSRRRDTRAYDWNTYMLVNPDNNAVVCSGGNNGYGLSLDEIEAALTEDTP